MHITKTMTTRKFAKLVRVRTPYGRQHSAHITWGYDYNEKSTLSEGRSIAVGRLLEKMRSLGLVND